MKACRNKGNLLTMEVNGMTGVNETHSLSINGFIIIFVCVLLKLNKDFYMMIFKVGFL